VCAIYAGGWQMDGLDNATQSRKNESLWPKKLNWIFLSVCSTLGWDQWPITLPHLTGLGVYTHTLLIGICRNIFHPHKPCGQEAFLANWHVLVHWVGIKPNTWDTQSQTQITWLDFCGLAGRLWDSTMLIWFGFPSSWPMCVGGHWNDKNPFSTNPLVDTLLSDCFYLADTSLIFRKHTGQEARE